MCPLHAGVFHVLKICCIALCCACGDVAAGEHREASAPENSEETVLGYENAVPAKKYGSLDLDANVIEALNTERAFMFKNDLFNFRLETEHEVLHRLYTERTPGVNPPYSIYKMPEKLWEHEKENVTLLLNYLFRNYTSRNIHYDIPVVLVESPKRESRGYDNNYRNSICDGIGYLESNLKNLCHIEKRDNYGLIELYLPYGFSRTESNYKMQMLPVNENNFSYFIQILRAFPSLIGFNSHRNHKGFVTPLTTLDKNIYSEKLNEKLSGAVRFEQLGQGCTYFASDKCNLYFSGIKTSRLLGQNFDHLDNYINGFSKKHNLRLLFDKDSVPHVDLKNTVLSTSEYINYGFYTEVELQMLADLGYDIYPSEFFGTSIYESGNSRERDQYSIISTFSEWNMNTKSYNPERASIVPLTVGTHVYGSYNDVKQKGNIYSQGYGAIGVRMDGSYNYLELNRQAKILENGSRSTGIAVAYGRDNVLDIDGVVEAKGEGGIALSFDFGSNVYSNLREYRGSYRTMRFYDVMTGKLSRREGSRVKADPDILGPLCSDVNIRGKLHGRKYSIYIDESAHVRNIRFFNNAALEGDILSFWEPYIPHKGSELYARNLYSEIRDGVLQFDDAVKISSRQKAEQMLQNLYTNLIFGVADTKVHDYFKSRFDDEKTSFDRFANISIKGDITGKSLNLFCKGGRTEVDGYLDVRDLTVSDAVFALKKMQYGGFYSKIESLTLGKDGILSLCDGQCQYFLVTKNAKISNQAIICVDATEEGKLQDMIRFLGKVEASASLINVEPGISYAEIKRFSSDPKALLNFLNKFVDNANELFKDYNLDVRFPKHVWYNHGVMGRKIKCLAKGCYMGDFVNNNRNIKDTLPWWRYLISFVGCVLMLILGVYIAKRLNGLMYG